MNQRLDDKFFVEREESCKGRGEVEVVSETNDRPRDYDLPGIREFDFEPAAKIQVFPVE